MRSGRRELYFNSFVSPDMFEEFFLPAYKKIYGFYKANGVELIVHHSDSYAANLVPHMIEMGIDIWQGVMTTNNIPDLIKQYGETSGLPMSSFPGVYDVVNKEIDRMSKEMF